MAIFDRNYDYGYRTGTYRGYDRDMGAGYRGTTNTVYDRDRNWNRDWYGAGAYDRNYYGYGTVGYDRGYKSRWETDYGDPFGDRTSRTPIRVMNDEFEGRYDRDMRAGMMYDRDMYAGTMYDRNYRGVSYDPYYGAGETRGNLGYGARGYDAGYRGWGYNNRGYDRGWF